MDKNVKNEREWFNNSNIITTVAIALLTLIIILSQSYAVKNNLSTNDILRNLLNHNTLYIIGLIYFIPLKTKTGKKYFNYLNVFLILIYFIFSITSLLSVIRSLGITSLISFGINIVFFVYMIHVFMKNTRFWKELKLEKSPFNEIKNEGYFYTIVVLAIILLVMNLIYSENFDGVVLSLVSIAYTIVLARYIYAYGLYLDLSNEDKKALAHDLFVEIDLLDKDLPKLKKLANEVSSHELNGYQIVALVTFGIGFCVGIIFGNLFPSCGTTSGLYTKACNTTEFNFSLTICIWFASFLICVFFYAIGNIISLLESINTKLKPKK